MADSVAEGSTSNRARRLGGSWFSFYNVVWEVPQKPCMLHVPHPIVYKQITTLPKLEGRGIRGPCMLEEWQGPEDDVKQEIGLLS